ncbi:MAG: YSC84-like protein 1 [Acidobacteriaceae bacterium]|jgi:lipid-binding SYLF domain-containing protein|nr:YSC84-like protein 1 [Acidobacteriaceae bacterium]MEA2260418.1 YSC84-like protein 1 [Acidobacteriaceae bacterium]
MKKMLMLLCMAGLCVPALAAIRSGKAALDQRVEASKDVIDEIMRTPDKSIPSSVMQKATCIAVVPSFKKGAFIVGAQYGQGVVTCRTGHGWSGPVFIRMEGGSFGFQAGAQGTDLVLVAVNQKGMQDLLKSKFKVGGDAAAAAGPVGRNAQASTDWKMNAELLTYSRNKGLLAGIDLDGTSVSQNSEDTTTYYGAPHPFSQILTGAVQPPASAQSFVQAVETYSRRG